MAKDLTVGNPLKQIVLFALPLYFGSLFQQVYNIIDTAIVGRFLGSVSLAGVGAASPVINFLISLLVGFSVGGSIVIARLFGEHDVGKTAQVVKTIVTASFVIALAISASGIIFARPQLDLLGTPADAMPHALVYLRIVLAGMLFTVFFNQLSGMLRGLGNSKTPLYFLVFSSCVNIVLDLVFIILLNWGVPGAAWATVIAQGISCVLMVLYIAKRVPELHFSLRGTPVSRESLQLVLRYGLPMGLQQSSISLGHVLMQG
ncbi:MAG: MATE family efflux transporter, partial [Eggerthellaceae bacterium]|nr:MATE family efflux transporter [Eggerthellaceae bacterium]